MTASLSRRRFLRAGSALVALPLLESLGYRRFAAAAAPQAAPKRAIFLGFGWGVTEESWYPRIDQPGPNYDLPAGLKPLARHKADFTVIQNLWNKYSNEGHAGSTWWLTGANRYAQPGQSMNNSISVDQVAAAELGKQTRFASLQLNGSDSAGGSGHGPGLSLSWDVRGKPIGGLAGPLEAYHRLFSKDATPLSERQAMLQQKRSVLDTVLEDARSLQRGLSSNDSAKLDEYFEGIRDIETRLSKDEQWLGVPQPKTSLPEPKPGLAGYEEIRLMYDVMLAAMQVDATRVFTYRQPVSTLLTSLDIKVHPHDMSHYHTVRGEKLDASHRRDTAQCELLAGFLDKLKATKEPDGSCLFDHTTLVYGSNLRTGHSLDNCPTIVTGRSAGLKLGHHIVASKGTPLCNLWLGLLHGMGIEAQRHGDSTGPLTEAFA